MGMDVYGNKPVSKTGEYFRANLWGWRPWWDLCFALAPEIISEEKHNSGNYNDGAGLGSVQSKELSIILRQKLEDGSIDWYLEERDKHLQSIPLVKCDTCGGTGSRKEPPDIGPGTLKCNGCNGVGKRVSMDTWYETNKARIKEFADFLADCGGFRIC